MKRQAINDLICWKNAANRKPLLLLGARQIGKTWLLKEFGRTQYQNVVHIDFERQEEYREFFATTKDPARILQNLSIACGMPIQPGTTLVIFDEIQECPAALTALKYFCEDAPEYHIAAAGSLLGITLAQTSYPVGKVNLIKMYPMNFLEFLDAIGDEALAGYLEELSAIEPIPAPLFNPLAEKLKLYLITGGMPESVATWVDTRSTSEVQRVLEELTMLYEFDFHKHAQTSQVPKIDLIWRSIPSQLARENKKFLYSLVRTGARAREYEDAVQWIVEANVLHKIPRSTGPDIPQAAYDEVSAFKLYLLDAGMLRRHAGLAPSAFSEGDRLFTEFKGALTENYVLQELVSSHEGIPRYWAIDNPRYEVDFLVQHENEIVPIEVKAGENVRARSLKKYRERYADRTPIAVRLSMRNLSFDDGVLNIPLFLAGQTHRLIDVAMQMKK
ncbi:ATP-binding protein [Collinsella provencensis]|uniref:ATP-binding protein n=1 Tax=Collinsella provencensis TaxID=1937461 RepID=UPI000C85CC91|nr:ATP-binding protein [Collinsella provencensis]